MNICLTTGCNNHCPFCFQKDLHKNVQLMKLDDLEKILNWAKNDLLTQADSKIQLLGGEPTLYPKLPEAIELIYKIIGEKAYINLITNLLCDKQVLEKLQDYPHISYLINVCYDENKKDLFYENLKLIKNQLACVLSITLTRDFELNKIYIKRLHDIFNQYPNLNYFRIGLEQPSCSSAWNNIYNYDRELALILDGYDDKININFDCAINLCQFSEYMLNRLISKPRGLNWSCENAPIDILPDLSALYCYASCEDFKVNNILDFKNLKALDNYFVELAYDGYEIKNKKCSNCELYKTRQCEPCHCIDHALLLGEQLNNL